MNEQALQDAYNLFVQQGYKKSIDDFKTLISTNQDALNDSYNLFASQGYKKSVDDYKALLGVGAPVAAPKVEAPLKKKAQVPTVLPSEDSFLASQSQLPSFETTPLKDITREQAVATAKAEKKKFVPATTEDDVEGQQSYWSNLGTKALAGVTSLDKMVASIPETIIDIASIPQNAIAWATGLDIAANSETFKKQFGISNPILDKLNEEEKRLQEKSATFNKGRYESLGIADNISKGNYADAFELLGSNIVESAPVSIAMMMGGATLAPTELVGAGTLGFFQQNREQLGEENPDMSEVEKTIKALGMAASETVFESVGTGTLGQVYKDIVTKEGAEVGKQVFRDGLVQMYKGALKKYGAPIGLLGEGVEEAATQITQNVISGKPAFEGAADAFITGAGSGVVFSAPINAIKAKQYISNTIDTYKSKNKIADVLKDTDTNLDQVYNVPKDAAITPQQLEIANTNKSRDILSKDLSKKVKSGKISEADAKQSLYVFDKVQQVSNAVKDLDVDADTKANIATLLRKRVELTTKIQNMDDALVVKEKQEIENINKQIEDIVLNAKPAQETAIPEAILALNDDENITFTVKSLDEIPEQFRDRAEKKDGTEIEIRETILGLPIGKKTSKIIGDGYRYTLTGKEAKNYAIQKQATDEGVLRSQQPEVGLQEVGKGNIQPEVVATGTEETITPESTQEVVSSKTQPIETSPFKVNGQEVTKEEFFKVYKEEQEKSDSGRRYNPNPAKIEYSGNDESMLNGLENYKRDNATHNNDGTLKDRYMKWAISKAFTEVPFRKFGNAFRKYIDPMFKASNYELNGMTFEENASYIIGDAFYDVTDEQFRKFADALDIQIPEQTDIVSINTTQIESNEQPTTTQTERNEQVQPQRTGDGGGRIESRKITPLKGSPSVKGINGPDPQLVAVAEKYAADNGIDLKRQSEYVEVDEDRAKRIADEYEKMAHDPQNPKVKKAYKELIKQTIAQYQALVDAGYKFWFMDLNIPSNVEYAESPYNALRDMRENKQMGVFPTTDGFGTSDLDVEDNPLLAETGFEWGVGSVDGPKKPVLANDLFRAVHDAFGHGLEGAGFRARGEENAWQAHIRLFKGPAIGAITSETRGQNSWLNYGPNGEKNRTAKVEDTVFADQKTGLMPEWTWKEGLAGDMEPEVTEEKPTEEAKLVIEEEEKFVPMEPSEVKTVKFNRSEALDYIEDEKETESGRIVPYLSSITVEATNTDGDPLGTITKVTDEDNIFYFTAEDVEGNMVGTEDGFETLGDAKKAIAEAHNKVQKKEFDKAAKKKAKQKEKIAAKKAKTEEKIAGLMDDLLALDPEDKTTAQKIQAGLDKLIKDIDKFEKENLGVNIALPVIKTILKAIKVLVDAGVSLEQAIKQAAKDNNAAVRDVVDGINAVNKIAPIQAEYDALMNKADALITRQKRRGIDDAKIVSNLDTMIRNSDVYKNADDAQKKIMEREARNKMGVGPKRAVSIGRVLGALKDITAISREEKMNVIKQIRDLSRDAAKELAKEIKDMATKGTITTKQAANIIARFGKVNMLNEISVSNFVDYMAKVFSNAEYANKIDVAKSKLKAAKKNIATKIGIADGLMLPLQRLFSINPTLIPDQYLERYLELVDMFGARQAVLTLEQKQDVTKDVQAILDEIDNERSKADELADRLNSSENKVYEDDKLDYAASIKKMLNEKEIDEKEAETMRKYKEDITPQVEETELTDEEAEQEKQELITAVNKSFVDSSELPTKDERGLAKELARLIRTDAINGLTNTELKNLLKVIDNINNNYLPHYAELMVEKMNAINNGKILSSAIDKAKPAKFSTLYARAKAFVAKTGRTGISELIRRNPLYYIDQLFGDYNTKDIFNSILGKAADAEALFKADLKKVQNILENAEEKVAKSFKLDANKTLMSKFKMMTYMVQLEYESNKGSKQVNPASDYLKATIKHIDDGKSEFGDRDAEMLQEILDTYTDADGNIDNEKLYNSFNQAEKDAIKDIRGVNESLADKAQYTAAIIRGERITPLNNYIHLNVLHEHQPNDLTTGTAFRDEYNNSMRPSTKAKSLIARTGKVSPINFDVFASAQRGAKFVLMDYNLTEPIRTARRTLNQALSNLEKNGRVPKEKRQIFNAINSAFEEAVENLLTNAYISDTLVDEAINYVNKQGYRAILAGTGRFVSELSSNIGFAMLADPKGFIEGVKNRGFIMSVDAPLVMENVKSKQTTRIFPTDTLAGKLIDTSILSQASGIKGAKSKNPVANKIQQIYNLTGKKYVNTVELVADSLISTPDKIVMRPMWFGAFANEFKDVTGKNVDFEKIAANDEEYMSDNKEAIEKAKDVADQRSVMAGATDNPFMGILKGTVKPNQSLLLRGFNNFNNFMTKFLIFEYVTARTAINAAMGNGSLSRKQGAAVLGAVATRMLVYTLLTQALGTGLIGLVFGGDDEPETEKSWLQKLGQAFVSTLTSMTIGRDFGNAIKSVLNYGVERANEKYLDFLREGDYDPYKDALQYSIVPPERKGRQTDLKDFLLNMGGSFGPTLKTADFVVKKAFEPEKKEEAAIERQKKEIGIRIPLEILGNAGLIPLYKDVRKEVMKQLYKDLEVAQENAGDKSEIKKEKLQGYETEGDMKRYDPELWNRTFGPDAPDYDVRQAEKALKKTKDSLERVMKDEMYDYVPRKKGKAEGIKKLY